MTQDKHGMKLQNSGRIPLGPAHGDSHVLGPILGPTTSNTIDEAAKRLLAVLLLLRRGC